MNSRFPYTPELKTFQAADDAWGDELRKPRTTTAILYSVTLTTEAETAPKRFHASRRIRVEPVLMRLEGDQMQAIKTQYFGPTNVRGSRVKASAAAGSITLSWDHRLNITENHLAAAKAFAAKFGWNGQWVGGTVETKSDSFMVWTCSADKDLVFLHINTVET